MPCYHPKVKTLGFLARNLIKLTYVTLDWHMIFSNCWICISRQIFLADEPRVAVEW